LLVELSNEGFILRLATVWNLRKLRDIKALGPLLRVLENPRDIARDEAALALAELIDDRITIPFLIYFKLEAMAEAKDPDCNYQRRQVLVAIAELIGELTDKNIGTD
jgi:HEAT repeat protein